jgi:hypothetical protein
VTRQQARTGGFVGFNPVRVNDLKRSTSTALKELGALTSTDPAASAILATIVRARSDFELLAMPHLSAVATDKSMTSWTTRPALNSTAIVASALGPLDPANIISGHAEGPFANLIKEADELLARIGDGIEGDPEAVNAFLTLLQRCANDPFAMAALLEQMGADGWWATLSMLGSYAADSDEAAVAAIDILISAVATGVFSPREFSVVAVANLSDQDVHVNSAQRVDPYIVMAMILGADTLPIEYITTLTTTIVHRFGDYAESSEAPLLGMYVGLIPPNAQDEIIKQLQCDPIEFLVKEIAQDAEQARSLLRDPTVSQYLFGKHPWQDDFSAMFAIGASAFVVGQTDSLGVPLTANTLHEINLGVTRMIAWIGERPHFDPTSISDSASIDAVSIAASNMISIYSVAHPQMTDPGPTGDDLLDDALYLPAVEHPGLRPDETREIALFDRHDAAILLSAAGSSRESLALLRIYTNQFYIDNANGVVSRTLRYQQPGGPPDENTEYINTAAATAINEGFLMESIFEPLAEEAAKQDELYRFWSNFLGQGIDSVVGVLNPTGISIPIGRIGADQLDKLLADNQQEVLRDATDMCSLGLMNISDIFI